MVRLKGLVEETRVVAVKSLEGVDSTEDAVDLGSQLYLDGSGKFDMDVAEIYVQTVVQLGKVMEPIIPHPASSESV